MAVSQLSAAKIPARTPSLKMNIYFPSFTFRAFNFHKLSFLMFLSLKRRRQEEEEEEEKEEEQEEEVGSATLALP